jgi:hypothetical protein
LEDKKSDIQGETKCDCASVRGYQMCKCERQSVQMWGYQIPTQPCRGCFPALKPWKLEGYKVDVEYTQYEYKHNSCNL